MSNESDLSIDEIKTGTGAHGPDLTDKWKLFDRRFDYAWKWFEFHAGQRTTVFNFFVVFASILTAAYGTLLREEAYLAALCVAAIGGLISVFFLFLDHRNEELVELAEINLLALERDVLYRDYCRPASWPRRRRLFFYRAEPAERALALGILSREKQDGAGSFYRHSIWIPIMQFLVAMAFLGGAGYAYVLAERAANRVAETTEQCFELAGENALKICIRIATRQ